MGSLEFPAIRKHKIDSRKCLSIDGNSAKISSIASSWHSQHETVA